MKTLKKTIKQITPNYQPSTIKEHKSSLKLMHVLVESQYLKKLTTSWTCLTERQKTAKHVKYF